MEEKVLTFEEKLNKLADSARKKKNVLEQQEILDAFAGDKLPYYVIQIAPHGAEIGDFRSSQYKLGEIDNVYVIGTSVDGPMLNKSDLNYGQAVGYDQFVHTSRKSPIGHRIADAVLERIYGENGEKTVTAPTVEEITADGDTVTVTFDTELEIFYGVTVEGFELAGEDGAFVSATATVSGNKVILKAAGVSAPKTVRYGESSMLIEDQSGEIIVYDWSRANSSDKNKATVICGNGDAHVYTHDGDMVIRSRYAGNITNASGQALPIFKLDVGYKR